MSIPQEHAPLTVETVSDKVYEFESLSARMVSHLYPHGWKVYYLEITDQDNDTVHYSRCFLSLGEMLTKMGEQVELLEGKSK